MTQVQDQDADHSPSTQALIRGDAEYLSLQGAAGFIEALRDQPDAGAVSKGVAIICHPHSLYGGNMDHKVVQTLAKAFTQEGWTAVRFNCRGVGKSAGVYDEGRGESQDLLQVIAQVAPNGPLALAGFSFGTHVVCSAAQQLLVRKPQHIVLVGTATSRFSIPPLPPEWHERALLIHGENDDVVPISTTLDWVRPQNLPLLVVPQGGHFFHGQQGLLKALVLRHLRSFS